MLSITSAVKRHRSLLAGGVIGLLLGGFLFTDTRPRSLLSVTQCEGGQCLHPNEVLGLIAAIGLKKAPGLVPGVIYETDKTLVVRHPAPEAPYHVVLIPKKDIKNIGVASTDDSDSLIDLYAVATHLIKENKLKSYRLWTNGPGNQIVAYLHFHLVGSPSLPRAA